MGRWWGLPGLESWRRDPVRRRPPRRQCHSFQLSAYTIANAMILYHLEQPSALPWVKNLTAQLNVKNLFNRTYYLSANDRFSIFPGAPRSFLASLRAEF
jgi:iron complex outermembrane recepter protein